MAIWAPQPGPQAEAITATWCGEVFFGGARGGGKSDFLIGDFLQDVERYAANWQGVLFRRTYPELQEIINRTHRIFPASGATWKEQAKEWRWPNKACLRMRYIERPNDASRYQGHQYTWIGWDELTQHPSREAYDMLKACLRWSDAEVKTKRIRASGNPGGAGHGWVREYFIDAHPSGFVPFDDPKTKMSRMYIPSRVWDNRILLTQDPGYLDRLQGVGSDALVRAWLDGDWNAIAGAYFTEFRDIHIRAPFEIPAHWTRFRAFDWGSARPFACGWFAVSDGTIPGIPKGALVLYREWYGGSAANVGLKMTAGAVADGILAREADGEKITYSVADPAIFTEDGGPSIGEEMAKRGVRFRPADNARVAGWSQLRQRLVGEELPMIFFFSTCAHTIRTLPLLQHDDKKPEDINTEADDHCADMVRYGCMSRPWARIAKKIEPMRNMHDLTLDELYKKEAQRAKRRR